MKPRTPFLLSLVAVLVGTSWLPVVAYVNPAAPPTRSVSTTPASIPPGEPVEVADTDRVSVAYTFPDPVVEHAGEFDRIKIPGLPTHGEPGTPVLPVKTAKILLPPGAELESIEVIAGGESVLGDGYRIEPGQELIPLGSTPTDTPTPPDPAIYGSAARFPGELHTPLSVQWLTGYTILLLNLHPVQYTPTTGELTFYQSLTVDVKITSPSRLGAASVGMLRAGSEDAERVRAMVDNPQALDDYASTPISASAASPQASLVDAGSPYDYIIVTSQALSSTFQALADWKASKGLAARIFATEAIYANYTGDDNPERIRNFIVDAYTAWATTDHPLQYVVLGGDDEIIPIRSIYVQSGGYSTWMPVDLYYAGLDGDWDADGDGKYGEPNGVGTAGEECDFFAEVYVGRMTVDNAVEAANIVSKTLAYEQNPTADYLDRALWLGNKLDDYTWGGDSKDLISDIAPQYNVTALYQRDGTYSTSGVINNMNSGAHLVNFDGHGNHSCCPLYRSQVAALTNDDYFLFYNLGCITAGFDQAQSGNDEAVAEHYVYTEHGAFAYIGNTRYGWYSPGSTNGPGNQLDRRFFNFAVNGKHNVGKALQLAKEDYYPGHRWSILTLHLLGDPETSLVTDLPVPVANISAPKGGGTLRYRVNVVGTARAGDVSGATFDHFLVEYGAGKSPGSWTQIGITSTTPVTVGLLATWDTTVLPDGTYSLRLTVDDGAGETSSDRVIVHTDNVYITTPAEDELITGGGTLTITGSALGTDFQNYRLEYGRGSSPGSWTPILSSTVPVTDSVLAVWDCSALTVADDYTIRLVRTGTEHVSTDQVTVYIDPSWQAGWPQSTYYRIVAPTIAAGDIDGDGDRELVATTSSGSSSSYLHVWHHDGTKAGGWPQWFAGRWSSAPVLIDLDRDGDLEIIVGSYDTKVYAWHHDGKAVFGWPKETGGDIFASPAAADLDGDGILEVVAASLDGNIYAWHYDGTPADGWPQEIGDAFYASPALGDLDDDERMEVVAATRQGVVHVWQDEGSLVTGWPITVSTPVSNVAASPALGDIAGDDRTEIVLAAGSQVYAWHDDGTPVAGWPVTAGGTITSSPALGDLDGNGDLEIVVGSDQVYAWHGDGTPVAGWPVTVTLPTNSSPVLGDITGDGEIDVVIGAGDEDERIYAWHRDGMAVTDWPRWVPAFDGSAMYFERLASPVLTDLDQDGDVEVAIGAENRVFVHDLPATYTADNLEWPMFQRDLQLTGWYTSSQPNLPPFVQDVAAYPWYTAPGSAVTITARVADEDGVASVTAEVESPDETVRAILTLYDDGLHGDGAAGDEVYGNTWTTLPTQRDYVIDLTATDTRSKSYTHDNIADFTTQDAPYVQYQSYTINRESISQDGVPSPGEFVECSLTLENLGVLDSPGVTVTVSTDDGCVSGHTASPIDFGDVAAGGVATSGDYGFSFQANWSCPHGYTVTFDLDIYDSLGNTWIDSFEVTILDTVGPDLYAAPPRPLLLAPGEPVTITAIAWDQSGVSSVQAVIESPNETVIATLPLYDDGAHDDGGAGDQTYGNTWFTTPSQERLYEVDFTAEDALANVRVYDNLRAFATRPFSSTTDILLVIDDQSVSAGSIYPYYTAALEDIGVSFDMWDCRIYGQVPGDTLQSYTGGAVIWATPGWGDINTATTQQALQAYLDAGGKLFITGQNIAEYSRWWSTTFLSDSLHAQYTQNIADSLTLGGVPDDPIGDGLQFDIEGSSGGEVGNYPDGITPLPPATTVFTYTGSSSGDAGAIKVDTGTFRVVYFSFGFEAIDDAGDRAIVMRRVLDWLLGPHAGFIAAPTSGLVPLTVVFTNTSTGHYTSCLWGFGDGITSTLDSPSHTYTTVGTYTVALEVNGVVGGHTETKPDSVIVRKRHSVYLPAVLRDFASE